jgi:trehalose synthase
MARIVEVERHITLDDYAEVAHLGYAVQQLRTEASRIVPRLQDRTIWMLNSTERGGGVAEMLPNIVGLLRDLGLTVEWAVLETDDAAFFPFTKRIHNLIHGAGEPRIEPDEQRVYDEVSRRNADALSRRIRPDDILIVHDPQPAAVGAMLKARLGMLAVWRCHIGLDEESDQTSAAWRFLQPYVCAYDRSVFTAPEYVPPYLAHRAAVIQPGIDPLSHKNRPLALHKLVGVLCDAGLQVPFGPVISPLFPEGARRLQPDGEWAPATTPEDIGLLFRPIVTQISRWDRLKGFVPLLRAFAELKRGGERFGRYRDERHRRLVETARLVLAGPEPTAVQDDPDAQEVVAELKTVYCDDLDPELQHDVVVLALPMGSRKHNALMVNALQRCSTIVVQNSVQEGFGLTATEAMWKRIPVLATRAVGLRQQIRDGLEGRLVEDAADTDELATVLHEMLGDEHARERWGQRAEQRVHDRFLLFSQVGRWLTLLEETVFARGARAGFPDVAARD